MGRTTRLIMWREMRERARTRSYMISTAVMVVLVFGGMLATAFLPDFLEEEPPVLGVVDDPETREAVEQVAARLAPDLQVRSIEDPATARADLEDGELDALLDDHELLFRRDPSPTIAGVVGEALHSLQLEARAAELGLDIEQARDLVRPPDLQVRSLDPPELDDEEDAAGWYGFASVFVLFVAIMASGNTVLMGVVEEKTSRVVEVVLGAARPAELLGGKVIGIILLGVAQLVAAGAAGGIGFLIVGSEVDLPPFDYGMLPVAAIFIVLGLLFYSFAYAAIGSTVSRQEEASNASLPITAALIGAYMLGIFVVLNEPDGGAARLLSILPPLSPMTLPPRVGMTDVPWWEVGVSVGLMAVATTAMLLAAERIYAAAILRQGPRLGLLQALRSAERTD